MGDFGTDFEFDVAISFAGEDRLLVEQVADGLKVAGVRAFYDRDQQANLWGQDLIEYFDEIYRVKSRFALLFISQHYAQKMWTRHERRSALARGLAQDEVYVLPVRLDDTELAGLRPTVAYLNIHDVGVSGVVDAVLAKLGSQQPSQPLEVHRVPRNQAEEQRLLQGRQPGWGYLYLAARLSAGVAALESKYLDHDTGYALSTGESVYLDGMPRYLKQATDDAQVLTASLMRLMEPAVQERAFGAPGTPGDPVRIAHLASRWTSAYEGFLDWATRLRGASVPNDYGQAVLFLADMVNEPIDQYRQFVAQLVQACDAIPAGLAEGRPLEITLTLTLRISDDVGDRYSRELQRIRRSKR